MARIYDIEEDDLREVTQADVDLLGDFLQTFAKLVLTSEDPKIKVALAGWRERHPMLGGRNA
jgi:hypothetical protein